MITDHTLDCQGLLCPMPVVELSRKIKDMRSGEVLELLADDEGARKDVPAWCSMTGNEYLGMEEGDSLKFYIRKK
ncbi:MAG: sulfurtransferase TusA family protein [Candidatus Hydrothermarchaeales archaeon]